MQKKKQPENNYYKKHNKKIPLHKNTLSKLFLQEKSDQVGMNIKENIIESLVHFIFYFSTAFEGIRC